MKIEDLLKDEELRRRHFPIVRHQTFLAHAAVCPLSQAAVDALHGFGEHATHQHQEAGGMMMQMDRVRDVAGRLTGAKASEIALLGPTALGLNLVALGFPWKEGDEVLYHADDYPTNVYPWTSLEARGVRPVALQPSEPGKIDWPLVEAALTPRTRMVALASAHFLTGFRIDVAEIGKRLQDRDIRFCLDAIQTLGSFPTPLDHVDYASADSHKWLLGPMGAGIFYVKESRQAELEPVLRGSWNVYSPEFIAQREIEYYPGARRYEPGSLNLPGNLAMEASMVLIEEIGIEAISRRLLDLRQGVIAALEGAGLSIYPQGWGDEQAAGMVSFTIPAAHHSQLLQRLEDEQIVVSIRQTREGQPLLRVSPHFYNTEEEIERLGAVVKNTLR